MNNIIKDFRGFKTNESQVEVPKYLYHSTFKPVLKKIKAEGLGGPSSKALWEDSKKGVVYLATTVDIAVSYAEAAFDENEDLPEHWEEKIVVLKIDTTNLDKSKIHIDTNVLDNSGDTLEYHGIIPYRYINNVINI